jgi:hypothetical protein
MKTTKELIIADITAKVEAKLASQKVESLVFNKRTYFAIKSIAKFRIRTFKIS